MEGFLSGSNSFMNLSLLKERKLFRGDVARQNGLEPVCKNLGYEFVQVVTEGEREEIVEGCGGVRFRDQGNEIGVNGLINMPRSSALFHHLK